MNDILRDMDLNQIVQVFMVILSSAHLKSEGWKVSESNQLLIAVSLMGINELKLKKVQVVKDLIQNCLPLVSFKEVKELKSLKLL